MKILMMVLILSGCQVDGYVDYEGVDAGDNSEAVKELPAYHCSDLTEYREIIEHDKTTYYLLKNTCNDVQIAVIRADGTLARVKKWGVVTYYTGDEPITITYSAAGFYYSDTTIGYGNNQGTQRIDYDYINGDDFITKTYLPSFHVKYIYEGDPVFDNIINGAHYDKVLLQVKGTITKLKSTGKT